MPHINQTRVTKTSIKKVLVFILLSLYSENGEEPTYKKNVNVFTMNVQETEYGKIHKRCNMTDQTIVVTTQPNTNPTTT